MLSIRFQSINIVSSTGDDCSNGAELYATVSGLTIGRTYTITVEKTSEYGNAEFYYAPHTFLAQSTELNNYLIKGVLLNARYFVLKMKISDDKNQEVYSEDITTVDCLSVSTAPAETPTSTPTYTPEVTPTPSYSQTPTGTPPITPSAQAYGVCIGTDKSSYSFDCCSGSAYSQHHKIIIGLVNLNIDNQYSVQVSSSNSYIKTFISETELVATNNNQLIDLYVSLNKNNTECAENKITVSVLDDLGSTVASREIDIYCILSDNQIVPDSYSCDNAVGVYFEDRSDFICLHFDESCPRYIGNASVVPYFTPTPTQTKTPTVTPTYSRTPTISNSGDGLNVQSMAQNSDVSIMSHHDDVVNLKTQIDPADYVFADSRFGQVSSRITNSITHNNILYVCGNATCNDYKEFPKTSAFVSKINLSPSVAKDLSFGQQGIVSLDKMRPTSGFDLIKIAETQNGLRLICVGMLGNAPVISRFLTSGSEDNSFATNGHLTLNNIHHFAIHKIFDIYIENDNTMIVFADATNTENNSSNIVVARFDFNGSLIELTPTAATRHIKPNLVEFKYSQLHGKKIVNTLDAVYVSFESFSTGSKNTVITTKILKSDYSVDDTFADHGYLYSVRANDNDHTFVDLFISHINLEMATKDNFSGYTDTLDGSYRNYNFEHFEYHLLNIVVNHSDHSVSVQKFDMQGMPYHIQLIGTEPVSNDVTFTMTVNENISTLHSALSIEEIRGIFLDSHIDNNLFSIDGKGCVVEILKMSAAVDYGEYTLLPVNVKVTSVTSQTNPGINKTLEQFENDSLLMGVFSGLGLNFRNCQILPCDRQPEDSYGSIILQKTKITKFLNTDRIYFGYVVLSNNLSHIAGVRLDSFDIASPNNIIVSAHSNNGKYLVVGNAGNLGSFDSYIKTINLDNNETPSYGPYLTDIVYHLENNNICG